MANDTDIIVVIINSYDNHVVRYADYKSIETHLISMVCEKALNKFLLLCITSLCNIYYPPTVDLNFIPPTHPMHTRK